MEQKLILELVKTRLNRPPGDTMLDAYLGKLIEASKERLKRKGITINDTADDSMLLVDYVVYRYLNRDKQDEEPKWLTADLRERWLSE